MPKDTGLQDLKPHYPALIIGAGINGCGLFRDLSLQGVDCLLIDRGDICEGASAAPSRLIHGGIKYLETGEFRLVRESAMERNRLLRNAPHFVKPLETVLPVSSWFGGSVSSALRFLGVNARLKDRGVIITELGLRIYDAYNRKVRALPDHRFWGPRALRSEYPSFAPAIKAAGVYYEGRITHAERLGMELVMDGLAANPSGALRTYVSPSRHAQPGWITLTDAITGEARAISCDVVVNAGGAWIDKINASLGIESRHMGGSKGSHLVVRNAELLDALQGRMIYFGTADGRVNLVYPFLGNVLIGSTDIPVKDPDAAACSEAETEYLLKVVSEILPDIRITREQVLLSYCGVRPLPRSEGVEIGAVSRDHAIARDVLPGTDTAVLSLIGGKWTTFRAFAAQSADLVLSMLAKPRRVSTEDLAIGGGRGFPADDAAVETMLRDLAAASGLASRRLRQLFARYGTKAGEVAATIAATPDRPLERLPGYSTGEIIHICRTEPVRRLSDLLLRRTAIAMEGLLSAAGVEEVADAVASALGWTAARRDAEITLMRAEMTRRAIPDHPVVQAAAETC
jgi:glycerol-3-phosphate dehydrogenase